MGTAACYSKDVYQDIEPEAFFVSGAITAYRSCGPKSRGHVKQSASAGVLVDPESMAAALCVIGATGREYAQEVAR